MKKCCLANASAYWLPSKNISQSTENFLLAYFLSILLCIWILNEAESMLLLLLCEKRVKKFSFYFFGYVGFFVHELLEKDAYFSVLINFCLCSMYNLVLARFQISLLLFLLLLLLLRYVYVCLCDSWDFILWIWNNKKSCKQIE